jgi:molybdopterin converting factor small subunit
MKIQISLYANFRQYAPGSAESFELDLAVGATVKTLIDRLKIPEVLKMVILINGRKADTETRLAEEDKITIFPPIEGG